MREPSTLGRWVPDRVPRTPTTTLPSGPSTAASKPPADQPDGEVELLLGRLEKALEGDPYWGICVALWRLLSRKRGYYGCKDSPLQNALGVADDGIVPWRYQIARIGEKVRRLRGTLGTIAIRETIMDIAGHAAVAVACLNVDSPPESPSLTNEERTEP